MIKSERRNRRRMGGRSNDLTSQQTTRGRNTGYTARNHKGNKAAPWIQSAHRTLQAKAVRHRFSPASGELVSAAGIFFLRGHSTTTSSRCKLSSTEAPSRKQPKVLMRRILG